LGKESIMHKALVYAVFGWLTLSGTMHFSVDVLSQYLRGKRAPGVETSLYYGLNSAYALGQVAFGLLGLFATWKALQLVDSIPVMLLSLAAGSAWIAIAFLFMEYKEPRIIGVVFCLLVVAAFATR